MAVGSVEVALPAPASATMQVFACGAGDAGGQNNIFTGFETFGIQLQSNCASGQGLGFRQDGVNQVPAGAASGWVTTAPPGLEITDVNVPNPELAVGLQTIGTGYLAQFYWNTGPPDRVVPSNSSFGISLPPGTSSFGWDLQCNPSGTTCPPACNMSTCASMVVYDIQLTVAETVSPTLGFNSNNLWYQGSVGDPTGTRWVYGMWPLGFAGSAPSGIAVMSASLNGQQVAGSPLSTCPNQNDTVWQQCPNGVNWSPSVSLSGDGNQQLVLSATSAAGNTSTDGQETIHVDSVQPSVSLSGPTEASSAAGTQYVAATAAAGLSGVQGISCSLDNGLAHWYPGSSANVPVAGIGTHTVTCRSEDNSYNPWGQALWSAPKSWSLDIGQPTLSGISFSKLVDTLKCRRVRARVRIAARWVTVDRHGKLVRVHRRARSKTVKVVKCHARTSTRRVTVWVKERRNGKTVLVKRRKVERVVTPPHLLSRAVERVAHGKGTTVSGWLGTVGNVALAGRTVYVMTAPNNGLGRWTVAAVVASGPDGQWSAHLPAGPSRLVEAAYSGDSTTLPSASSTIHLVVPARVKIHIAPRSTRWGGTIDISGRVLGGYIPAGKLLRLRIGVAGVRETVGIPNVRRDGRFQTTWTFAPGRGVVRYWFSISTLNEADYSYAPASSRRVYVKVGPG
jgi:hypothetical protein